MKWKRTKKGSKDHARDGKQGHNDDDEQKLEIDERDEERDEESDSEDNFNIQVDSPNPDIDEPQSPPALEVKTEREENSNPFYCSQAKTRHLPLSPQDFLSNTNLARFSHCPPFPLRQNPFLRQEDDNH